MQHMDSTQQPHTELLMAAPMICWLNACGTRAILQGILPVRVAMVTDMQDKHALNKLDADSFRTV